MDVGYIQESVGPFPTALGAAFNTFTTKKSVDALPVPVILSGKLRAGSKLAIKSSGEYSATATPNVTVGYWLGTRALAITLDLALSPVIVAPNATAWQWDMWWDGICVPGASAGLHNLVGMGGLRLGASLTTFNAEVPIHTTAALRTVAIDVTIERAIGVSWTWSASAAGNNVQVYTHNVTIQN
jgi:hypothetical protein